MFITIKTRWGEQIINTDHIIRIQAPKGDSTGYYIYLDEIDHDEEGNIGNLWYYVHRPTYEEMKERLCG